MVGKRKGRLSLGGDPGVAESYSAPGRRRGAAGARWSVSAPAALLRLSGVVASICSRQWAGNRFAPRVDQRRRAAGPPGAEERPWAPVPFEVMRSVSRRAN